MQRLQLPRWLLRWLPRHWRNPPALPDALWQSVVSTHPFLAALSQHEQTRLRQLSTHFILEKTFYGAHGFQITDFVAVSVAAQACVPLIHMTGSVPQAIGSGRWDALDWYDDFVGIVVQPGASVALREVTDALGVVHRYREVLAGEAMHHGPVMLSWQDVRATPLTASSGHNVVIHEFVHKIDMHGKPATDTVRGAPLLPPHFLNTDDPAQAQALWQRTMQAAFDDFSEAVAEAERFGQPLPWLDVYAAQNPAEFFAVTCEAYFVNRARFGEDFPTLLALYDGFFRQPSTP